MNVSDLLEALSQADPQGSVVIDVDSRQRPVDAVFTTDGAGATVLLADPAGRQLPFRVGDQPPPPAN